MHGVFRGNAGISAGLAALWLVLRAIGSVIVPPLAEEQAFTAYSHATTDSAGFHERADGQDDLVSCIASSLFFGLLHGRWLAGTLAGLLFAVRSIAAAA